MQCVFEKTEINEKEAGVGPFKNIKIKYKSRRILNLKK